MLVSAFVVSAGADAYRHAARSVIAVKVTVLML